MIKIALVNPVSSGKCLANAFEDSGCKVISIFDQHLAPIDNTGYIHRSLDDTLSWLRLESPIYVLAGSEHGVGLAEQLAHRLGLPTNDISRQQARLSKSTMLERLHDDGICVARSCRVTDEQQLNEIETRGLSYPVFIKPAASAGSDGCSRCQNGKELKHAFTTIFSRKNLLGRLNDEILVQEYIEGVQYVVNTVSSNGHHLISEIYRVRIDEVDAAPVYRSMISCEIDFSDTHVRQMVAYVQRCLDSLGICNGAAHTELRMTSQGPRLIEVNSRIMGPVLHVDAFFNAFGYSQATLLVESCLHHEDFMTRIRQPRKMKKHFSMVFLRNGKEGAIVDRAGLETIRRLPAFHSVVGVPRIGYSASNPLLTTGDFGIAYLVHEDRFLLEHSLDVLHSLEDEHGVYGIA